MDYNKTKKENIVGVDFSLNSTAICIYNIKKENYKFYNFINTKTLLNKKKTQILSQWRIHDEIKDFVELVFIPRNTKDSNYAKEQTKKIEAYSELVNAILAVIPKNSIIGLEGFSFASKGQGFIDLIIAQTILRKTILDSPNNHKLLVISPSSIKKVFTGKGNSNKVGMLNSFKETTTLKHELFDYAKATDLIKKEKEVLKPVDDLIDAYAILHWLNNN